MKSLFIIPTHAPTRDKQAILVRCIEALKAANTGFDIMITSHAPLPADIINMVDYYVYDKDNRFSNAFSCLLWKRQGNIIVNRIQRYSHEYPIIRLLRNAVGVAKINEYDFFLSTDFDNIYSVEDVQKFIDLKHQMVTENKEFIFFKPSQAVWTVDGIALYGIYYDLTIFGGMVSKFLELFDNYFPKTLEEYNAKLGYILPGRPQCLEHYFYNAFNSHADSTVITDAYIKDYVTTSTLNESGLLSTMCMILPSADEKYYLYMSNDNLDVYTFKVYIDGQFMYECELTGQDNSLDVFPLIHNCSIRVEVINNTEHITTHHLEYRQEKHDEYKKDGSIIFS